MSTRDIHARERYEFGPTLRAIAPRYFAKVRFPSEALERVRALSEQGLVVHVMRTSAWINYLYLAWATVHFGLLPIRAAANLRIWLTRPWRRLFRGTVNERFEEALHDGSGAGLVFLRSRGAREDPFPALVAIARRHTRPIYLLPELFVWEKWSQRLKPGILDFLFGSPEAPGFFYTLVAFYRNYWRAQLRVGEPINLTQFVRDNAGETDEIIARKARGALNHHLARETRAVFGPPLKPARRMLDEAMRDRVLRGSLEEIARETGRSLGSVTAEARRLMDAIGARYHPTVVALIVPILRWIFDRIYDGIEVDESGFDRAMRAASKAPIVLVPSHKSHIDYLVMSYVLWVRGYALPYVASGANLSFFPLGPFLRRAGAFFLRRSFKGDRVYTAVFKAYIKKLVHDGIPQEFFPEGARSRTGKLLPARLGVITWELEAVLEGARPDLLFLPIAIDYERLVESSSHSREVAGAQKKPEDLRALLTAPRVLAQHYGSIHLTFDEPVSLVEFARSRGLELSSGISEDDKKGLVRALGNRIMYGISRVSTITAQAMVSSALLAHRRRGITTQELAERVVLIRHIANQESARLAPELVGASLDPTLEGPIREALRRLAYEGMVRISHIADEVIYHPLDEARLQLSFYKNTLLNLLAPRSLVATALLTCSRPAPVLAVKEAALFLSRLLKFELIYKVGATFDTLFESNVHQLQALGLARDDGDTLSIPPGPYAQEQLDFLADLLRDHLESFWLASLGLPSLLERPQDRRQFIQATLEQGRAAFYAGRIGTLEAVSVPNIESALVYFIDRGIVTANDKTLALSPAYRDRAALKALAQELARYTRP